MSEETPGARIKMMRIERKMTQEKLSQHAGISMGFLSDLENGKTNVGADKLLDIAGALDVSLDYLMKGEETQSVEKVAAVELPASLVRLASEEGLTVNQARQLLAMRRQIVAFRNDQKGTDLESFDWGRLYGSVKDFIK